MNSLKSAIQLLHARVSRLNLYVSRIGSKPDPSRLAIEIENIKLLIAYIEKTLKSGF